MCKIKIALSNLSEKIFSRKWPSLWEKPIDTLENRVVKLPCRRSMIPGSRMWLWTFWWIERINAKLSLSPRFRVGVCFDTVRESACMACKRSPVRSRYSPPKKHCTSFEVRCFSFYWSRFLGAALLCLHRFQAFAGGSYTTPNVWRYTIFKLESDLNLPSEKTEKSYSNLGILLLCPTWRKSFRKLPHCLSPNGH